MKKTNQASLVILGILPFTAVTSKVYYAFWTALIFAAVVILSSLVGSMLRKLISGRSRLLIHTAIGAGLTAAADMLLKAYVPAVSAGIGICLSFLAVNALGLTVSETTAENNIKASAENAAVCAGMGSGILIAAAAVRELLRYGTLFSGFGGGEGIRIFADWFSGMEFVGTSAGALIVFGLMAAAAQKIAKIIRVKQKRHMLLREMIVSDCHPNLVIDDVTGKTVRRSTAAILAQHRQGIETIAENSDASTEANAENDELELDDKKADAENADGEVKA